MALTDSVHDQLENARVAGVLAGRLDAIAASLDRVAARMPQSVDGNGDADLVALEAATLRLMAGEVMDALVPRPQPVAVPLGLVLDRVA